MATILSELKIARSGSPIFNTFLAIKGTSFASKGFNRTRFCHWHGHCGMRELQDCREDKVVSRSLAKRDAPGQTKFLGVERFRLEKDSLTKSSLSFQFVKTINMATLDNLFPIARVACEPVILCVVGSSNRILGWTS